MLGLKKPKAMFEPLDWDRALRTVVNILDFPRNISAELFAVTTIDRLSSDRRESLTHGDQMRRLATRKRACDRSILRSTRRCGREIVNGRIVVGEQIVACCKRYVRLALDNF